LRSGKPDGDVKDSTFTKLDQVLPAKMGQSHDERAKEIDGAMDWMRHHGISLNENGPFPAFECIISIPVSRRSPDERKQDIADVLNWLKSGKKSNENHEQPSHFKKLDIALPKKSVNV
jgi:hypothetical protein